MISKTPDTEQKTYMSQITIVFIIIKADLRCISFLERLFTVWNQSVAASRTPVEQNRQITAGVVEH